MVQYQPPSAFDPTQDVFQASQAWPAQYARQQAPLLPSRFETFRIPRAKGIVGFRVIFEDFRPGLNKQVGAFERHAGRLASSTLDSRYQEVLCLPQLKTAQNNTLPGTSSFGMGCNIFGTFVMSATDNASAQNPSLFMETSATNPALQSIAWPGLAGPVNCLQPITIGGYGKPRLCVGNNVAGAQILSAIAPGGPTVDGQMHANTAGLFGLVQTTINTDTILLYAGTLGNASLMSLKATDAIGTLPTTVLANVPPGGYALGLLSLSGGPLRAWWVWPPGSVATGQVAVTGQETLSRVMSTNQEGTDPQELKFPLKGVIYAQIFRDGIVASDGERIVWQNGRQIRDLRIFADRTPNSDYTYRVRGMAVNGPELEVAVEQIPGLNSGATATNAWVETYDFDLDAWENVLEHTDQLTSGLANKSIHINMIGPEGMGFSQATRFMHRLIGNPGSLLGWHRHYCPPYGTNPFTLRQTAGAGASSGYEFAASGIATSAQHWLPPPLKGAPLSVKRIICLGDIDAGGAAGSAANAVISCGGVQATFVPGHSTYPQVMEVEDDLGPFGLLQLSVTLNRTAATTRMTPQALPIIVEGYASIREMPEPPYAWFDLED